MTAKQEARDLVYYDLSTDRKISEFLNGQRPTTKHTYTSYIQRLKEFTNDESGQSMLDHSEDWLQRIFVFSQWLRNKTYSSNYIESATGCVRGFFSFNRKALIFTNTEKAKLRQRNRTTTDFEFNAEVLSKMYLSGRTAKSRYVVAMAKSIGLRSEDFVTITFGQLRRLDLTQEIPIFFGEVETNKEGVRALCFLDSDAITAIKELLAVSADKTDKERIWNYNAKYLSPLLRRLAKRAHIDPHETNIRFHCFRHFLFDNLNQVMSLDKAKMVIGKRVSEAAYLSPNTLRESFTLVMPKISFSGNGVKSQVKDLTEENKLLKSKVAELERQIVTGQNGSEEMKEVLKEILKDKLGVKEVLGPDGKKYDMAPVSANKWSRLLQKLDEKKP